MKNIFIVGGDGFARECFTYLKSIIRDDSEISFGGFLGTNGFSTNFGKLQHHFLGDVAEYSFANNDYAIIGFGDPTLRKDTYLKLKNLGIKLYNLFFPIAAIDSSIEIGEGNIFISDFPIKSCDIKIGNGNLFNNNILLGHDVEIGDFNFFGPSTINSY